MPLYTPPNDANTLDKDKYQNIPIEVNYDEEAKNISEDPSQTYRLKASDLSETLLDKDPIIDELFSKYEVIYLTDDKIGIKSENIKNIAVAIRYLENDISISNEEIKKRLLFKYKDLISFLYDFCNDLGVKVELDIEVSEFGASKHDKAFIEKTAEIRKTSTDKDTRVKLLAEAIVDRVID